LNSRKSRPCQNERPFIWFVHLKSPFCRHRFEVGVNISHFEMRPNVAFVVFVNYFVSKIFLRKKSFRLTQDLKIDLSLSHQFKDFGCF
jgi:hypothetical protein